MKHTQEYNQAYADFKKKFENVPDGLDLEAAKQSAGGQGWGKEDQARYDAIMAKRGEAKDRANQHISNGKTTNNTQSNNTQIKNTQGMKFNQDNDQEANFQGDNNYVYQNQDMSVRQYGGDNRSFVYNSNGEGPDTPATMATLAGYYAPDDSPAATAKRLDQHVTMNRDNQKQFKNTSYIAEGAIKRAERNSYINPRSLGKRIADRSKYHMAESTIKGAEIFGDIYGLESPTWNSSKPAKPVEKPDFDKMYDTYTDF